jgi:hypothetical protein
VAWSISGRISPYARPGVDANGWLWEIEREGVAKRVLVEISGTAWATDSRALPEETREAIDTEGLSELRKVLEEQDPPRVIACGTWGCGALTAEQLAAAG